MALTVLVGCFGGSLGGEDVSLPWGWVLRELWEQMDVLTRRWEALGGAVEVQVRVAFSFIYICTKITDFHVSLFPAHSFMFPVAGGLGPPQGMYERNILSTKFLSLFRYIKQLKLALHGCSEA